MHVLSVADQIVGFFKFHIAYVTNVALKYIVERKICLFINGFYNFIIIKEIAVDSRYSCMDNLSRCIQKTATHSSKVEGALFSSVYLRFH
jgi:hypothetical protein